MSALCSFAEENWAPPPAALESMKIVDFLTYYRIWLVVQCIIRTFSSSQKIPHPVLAQNSEHSRIDESMNERMSAIMSSRVILTMQVHKLLIKDCKKRRSL